VALGLALTMLGAITLVHLPAGFFAPNGIEFPLALLGGALALALSGPGKISLDHRLVRRQD
jgi:putative oxidoreductase